MTKKEFDCDIKIAVFIDRLGNRKMWQTKKQSESDLRETELLINIIGRSASHHYINIQARKQSKRRIENEI